MDIACTRTNLDNVRRIIGNEEVGILSSPELCHQHAQRLQAITDGQISNDFTFHLLLLRRFES